MKKKIGSARSKINNGRANDFSSAKPNTRPYVEDHTGLGIYSAKSD